MSNYTKTVDFAAKDALVTGNPLKAGKGTEIDAEFVAIQTAISSKEDTANKNQANGYAGLDSNGKIPATLQPGLTINSKTTSYTFVLGDANQTFMAGFTGVPGKVWTIPANSSVAFPVGTVLTLINGETAINISIQITTDTLNLSGAGTGSRNLGPFGMAQMVKITSTSWIIFGQGLS